MHIVLKLVSLTDYSYFQNVFTEALNKYSPLKDKILRYNINAFMKKKNEKSNPSSIKVEKYQRNEERRENTTERTKQKWFSLENLVSSLQ